MTDPGASGFHSSKLLDEKYSRQMLFAGIGRAGQEQLLAASAVIVGCGAIGATAAALLVRAGVGRIRVIDRDFIEPSNLQRQSLFDEADAASAIPKAAAAERKLRSINSAVSVEGLVSDLNPSSAAELLSGFDLILDGTDNFETRFLLNDFAVKHSRPWIYAAAVASYGVTMPVRPGLTPCLRCLLPPSSDGHGFGDTCDTVGVLGPIVSLIASYQSADALKLLSGHPDALEGRLFSCDVWTGRVQSVRVSRDPACLTCAKREFPYLEGIAQPHVTLCGRDSVQIHERGRALDLSALRGRLVATVSDVRQNDFLLCFRVDPYQMTIFSDGRAILKGTKDPAVARSLYARYIGA